jgi:hypothetical protein
MSAIITYQCFKGRDRPIAWLHLSLTRIFRLTGLTALNSLTGLFALIILNN